MYAGGGGCSSEGFVFLVVGIAVDWAVCFIAAFCTTILSFHVTKKYFVKHKLFWATTSASFTVLFLGISLLSLLYNVLTHKRGMGNDIGFPFVFSRYFMGATVGPIDLATDAIIYFTLAFLWSMWFFRRGAKP